jgi:RND family efflux transporter MFP subunit
MTRTRIARGLLFVLITAGFSALVWQLLQSAPQSNRERPPTPLPLVDVVPATPGSHSVDVRAAGTVRSAFELAVRPQVGGRIVALHPDFEPGGQIAAGSTLVAIDPADYRLEIAAAEAEVAKALAAKALEQGRRVVAREELASLGGSLEFDRDSQGLALREPQLRQVQAELAAARNRLQRAQLDLERTRLTLPYDVIVLERERVSDEIVAARERIGRVSRADTYWVELSLSPDTLPRLRARSPDQPGSAVSIRHAGATVNGEIVRIRADVASGSRLAGVIAEIPVGPETRKRLLIGSFVEARIDAGRIDGAIRVPRRALRDNGRVWVVDGGGRLQVRGAEALWENEQSLLLSPAALQPGDRIVVSRVSGMVPGAEVRVRTFAEAGSPDE